ncbi:molybdate transport system permease protein [Desulfuromusa kysingii]|uniref:Molybdate transport system permease protein n=1 Tax=Desulfuromusa kysingii TaxID=37625 RepID=A0A1H3X3X0_9BACT|nr:ABC transporter permease subunit [Desulfuromusa kysingii]SDZ94115.1 molybdate transport system permease protein [Desulfuromusa kysingii]
MDRILELLSDKDLAFTIALTAKTCCIAVALHAIFGLLIGYYLARKKSFCAALIDLMVTLPLVFPPIGTGFILLLMFGRNGVLGKLGITPEIIFTEAGVVTAAFIAGLPLVVKPIQSAIEKEVFKLAEAAKTLGKNEVQVFFLIVVPAVKRSLGAGLILAVGRSLGEVGITLMVGGNIIGKTNTISLEVYNSVMDADFLRAGVLCLILGSISVCVFFALRRLSAL